MSAWLVLFGSSFFLFSLPRKFSVSHQFYMYFFHMQNPFVSVIFGLFNMSNLIFTCVYLFVSEFDQFDNLSLSVQNNKTYRVFCRIK